jgi:hypothetical protein
MISNGTVLSFSSVDAAMTPAELSHSLAGWLGAA